MCTLTQNVRTLLIKFKYLVTWDLITLLNLKPHLYYYTKLYLFSVWNSSLPPPTRQVKFLKGTVLQFELHQHSNKTESVTSSPSELWIMKLCTAETSLLISKCCFQSTPCTHFIEIPLLCIHTILGLEDTGRN